jgi:hypothetical protein
MSYTPTTRRLWSDIVNNLPGFSDFSGQVGNSQFIITGLTPAGNQATDFVNTMVLVTLDPAIVSDDNLGKLIAFLRQQRIAMGFTVNDAIMYRKVLLFGPIGTEARNLLEAEGVEVKAITGSTFTAMLKKLKVNI